MKKATLSLLLCIALYVPTTSASHAVPQLAPTLNWTISDYNGAMISCAGSDDGSIDLQISGGTPPYSISWSGPGGFNSSDEDINGLAAGNYNVTVTDGNNETTTASIDIVSPAVLGLTGNISNKNGYGISCHGGDDGDIDITVTGGTAPYTYNWTDPSGNTFTDEDMLDRTVGNYNVIVTDANGCSVSAGYTLTEPDEMVIAPILSAHFGGYNVSCSDATDGKIDITPAGGVSPHSFVWNGPNSFLSNAAHMSGLAAGDYTLELTDDNGCVLLDTIALIAPEPMVVNLMGPPLSNGHHIPCAGDDSGFINCAISGGTPYYEHQWNGPDGFASGAENISGLVTGAYQLTVTDTNGCISNANIHLTEPDSITVSTVLSDHNGFEVSCNGGDGSIDVSTQGGVGGYSYYWIGPNASVHTSEDLNNLVEGNYSLNVMDANNCSFSTDIMMDRAPILNATLTVPETNGYAIACGGANTGQIDATFNNANGVLTHSWTGPNGFTASTEDINSLEAGLYELSTVDALGCEFDTSLTLNAPTPISTSLSSPQQGGYNIPCKGESSGVITTVFNGGVGTITSSWTGPGGFTSTDADISGLAAGNYMVTVQDDNGCESIDSISLSEPNDALTSTATTSTNLSGHEISCGGAADGWADMNTTGGTAPYSFLWSLSNGMTDTNEDLAGLPAGTHLFSVTDALGCTFQDTLLFEEPDPIVLVDANLSSYGAFNVSCSNSTDGSTSPQFTGGIGVFTYSWNGPNGFNSTDNNLNSLEKGSYSLTVTDENNCIFSDTIILTAPSAINAGMSANQFPAGTQISCAGADDASITISATGGAGTYTYSWTGPGSFTSSAGNISGLAPGNYCLTVSDISNCQIVECITISEPAEIDLSSNIVDADCGSTAGGIDLLITGGSGPFSYSWSNGESTEDLSNIGTGTYVVSVSDANGCTALLSNEVNGTDALTAFGSVQNVHCPAGTNGSIDLNMTNGSAPYSYSWSNGMMSQDVSGIPAGDYTVEVTDAQGCEFVETYSVEEPDPIIIELQLSDYSGGFPISSFNAQDGEAIALVSGGTAPYDVQWSTGESGVGIMGLSAGEYGVAVSDAFGCTANRTFILEQPYELAMPNGISPNGDGYNDVFVIRGIELYPNNTLTILNRWGDAVYTSNNYRNDWNGVTNSGNTIPDGTYFVVFTVPNQDIELTGFVEVRR